MTVRPARDVAPSDPPRYVALLRGINVGGHKRLPMRELSALAEAQGFERVSTYIQSGNVLFSSELTPDECERALESAIESRFDFSVDVVVRDEASWRRYASDDTFSDAARERPKMLHLALSKRPVDPEALPRLLAYAKAGERVAIVGDALWLDYNDSVGRSKLTPAALDRCVGSPVTARNWSTVQALAALL
jgi:uncharacterized protein (DUF1697 family)